MPRAFGQVATSATTEVQVNKTTYTEQTSGAQRALKSSSANDAAAGTGVRTVRVVYYTLAVDGTVTGPFVETVTLNGTNAVATVATNIALIERLEAVTAGSGGVAAGTISLTAASDGTGTTIASIATGDVQAQLAHHYVPSKYACEISDLAVSGGNATAALFQVKVQQYPIAGPELSVTGQIGSSSTAPVELPTPRARVVGPCRLAAYVAPTVAAQTSIASFGYKDERVNLT